MPCFGLYTFCGGEGDDRNAHYSPQGRIVTLSVAKRMPQGPRGEIIVQRYICILHHWYNVLLIFSQFLCQKLGLSHFSKRLEEIKSQIHLWSMKCLGAQPLLRHHLIGYL